MKQVPMTHLRLMNQLPMTHPEWRLSCFVVSGIVLFCFFLYFFFFFCLGVTFKAFGDPLESVDEVSSL
jgi:hypothetical protein